MQLCSLSGPREKVDPMGNIKRMKKAKGEGSAEKNCGICIPAPEVLFTSGLNALINHCYCRGIFLEIVLAA